MRRRRSNRTGFTLVEMLAVILVIGILVAIVVSVAGKGIAGAAKARTEEAMTTIMTAVDAYFEEKGEYPQASGATADARSSRLYSDLRGCESSKTRLANLTKDVLHDGRFYDGFEQAIDYRDSGGKGGGPYLESAGRDAVPPNDLEGFAQKVDLSLRDPPIAHPAVYVSG